MALPRHHPVNGSLPPWPPLPPRVRRLLAPANPHLDEPVVDEPAEPPRPWDLCSLDGELAAVVFSWLDEVAVWHNATYAGQDHQVIPACWPQHPSVAHDLAALAFSRVDVYQAATAAYVPRWHHDLESFHHRLAATLGPNPPCLRGDHDALPRRYAVEAAEREMVTGSAGLERSCTWSGGGY
ncbi:hypothetical protein [Streptomyces sedi]|uniref:Uncharacterized protein n=1 Tax=Streptomyces sedi TaxID=555059 RepID=A0A5C4UQV1_9ACTN|nr:hypothetical protein [Streptomyces sedi]TNM25848.1 hypothetical protein FH715_25870 [Streptomyces sedi]